MPERTNKNKIKVEEIMQKFFNRLRINCIIYILFGFMLGFIVSEFYYTYKIKNMVYWNQVKIDRILTNLKVKNEQISTRDTSKRNK